MTGNHFAKGFGGKAANQCVMACKLGASMGMIAKVNINNFFFWYYLSNDFLLTAI